MTIFHVAYWLASLAWMLVCAWVGHHMSRPGLVIGLLLGLWSAEAFPRALSRLVDWYGRERPLRPACRRGCCQSDQYRHVGDVPEGSVFVCECGDRYVQAGVFRQRFWLEDGQRLVPYKQRWLDRWQDDRTPPAPRELPYR